MPVDICHWHLGHAGDPGAQQIARWRCAWLTGHLTDPALRCLLADHHWRHTHNLIGGDDTSIPRPGLPATPPTDGLRSGKAFRPARLAGSCDAP